MHATRSLYLTKFWKEKNVLSDNTMSFFRNELWKFRSLLLGGGQFWVESHVVVRPDADIDNDDHVWMWKTRIKDFFVHECEGILEVFFLLVILTNDCLEKTPTCLFCTKRVLCAY
jgi:hypothetical protein